MPPVERARSDNLESIGSYDLTEVIAEGGMGTVYKGRHRLSGDVVAVKIMPRHLLANPINLKRFEQEYAVARAIDHPNIVKAIEFGREDEKPYLVMEYVNGESVGQLVERQGKLSEEQALAIIIQVAEGLQKAHEQGLIHRDVKPDNILVTADGLAKLTDLGLAKELETDLNLTRTGRGLGTPHFMAPEQFRNAKKADVRCDLYSLGATLYQMVTGELPFPSKGPLDAWMRKVNNEITPPRQLVPELSEKVDWAIRRAMSPQPLHRPESCREFIQGLLGQGPPPSDKQESTLEGPDLWHVMYQDDSGVLQKLQGTTLRIRRALETGILGVPSGVRVTPSLEHPYEDLDHFTEFRDLAGAPKPEAPAAAPVEPADDLWKWLATIIIIASIGVLGYFVLLRWRWF
jgi:serine/threonine protein kinase